MLLSCISVATFLVGNRDHRVHARLDVVRGDVTDDLRGSLDIHQSLVDAHLIGVVGLRTLTVRRLTGGHLKHLGGHANRALGVVVTRLLGTRDDTISDSLDALELSGCDGDSHLHYLFVRRLNLYLLVGHCRRNCGLRLARFPDESLRQGPDGEFSPEPFA